MNDVEPPPRIVRWTLGLEDTTALDRPVKALEPRVHAVFGSGTRAAVLRGEWLGHAIHPLLTEVVLGTWTSANALDLIGGVDAASSAQKLIGTGLLAYLGGHLTEARKVASHHPAYDAAYDDSPLGVPVGAR